MKSLLSLLLIFLVLPFSGNSSSALPVHEKTVESNLINTITVKDFLSLSVAEYEKLTGKKLQFTGKLSFKLMRHQVKKAVKKGKLQESSMLFASISVFDDFNMLGFILGFLLGPIGVAIGYLTKDENIIKWTWMGFGAWALILVIAILI
mgnify:CR=1 FL=1|jgi:hypothetical protein